MPKVDVLRQLPTIRQVRPESRPAPRGKSKTCGRIEQKEYPHPRGVFPLSQESDLKNVKTDEILALPVEIEPMGAGKRSI